MKFMMMVKAAENPNPPPKALMEAIAKLGEEAVKSGAMVQMGGLMPTFMGGAARVRVAAGELSVVDGPFTEAKEVVGGFAVYEVKSKDEAIEWARRFMDLHKKHWPGWQGETELRQFFDPGACSPDSGNYK